MTDSFKNTLRFAEKGTDFSFDGLEFQAKVVEVYDGDTIRVKIFVRGEIQQHRVRMYGYGSPEMKPRLNVADRDDQIQAAHKAKSQLEHLIQKNDQLVLLQCGLFDKYGRILGKVFVDDLNVNEWMINHGYGTPYFGGRKAVYSKAHIQFETDVLE